MSMDEGLWIYMTRAKHQWLHTDPEGQQENERLKKWSQRKWLTHIMEKRNIAFEEAQEEWLKKFSRNYI